MIELRNYQVAGIETIKLNKNYGLFWQQRLGKTIVAIKAIENYDKVLICVPNNTILHWYNEIIENTDITPIVCNLKAADRKKIYHKFNNSKKMWIITSYDLIVKDFKANNEIIKHIDYLVLDEAHFLRNIKTARTKMMLKIRAISNYALALSGTPAVNNTFDILKIFKFIYNDRKYGHLYYFKKKFFTTKMVDGKKKYFLNDEHIDEWYEFIHSKCDIKNVHDYLVWLPKSITKNVALEMNSDQKFHYQKMLLESKRIITSSKEKTENKILTQILRLQQIALDPNILNIEASSIKINWLKEFLNEILENETEQVIVFTNFTSLYKKWNFEISTKYAYDYLIGGMNIHKKNEIIKAFQNKKIRVLFANTKVASLGLTLDSATVTVFLDKSWNPTEYEQACFRMVDTYKKKNMIPKLIINVSCQDSIDQKIDQVLDKKRTNTSFVYEMTEYFKNI